MSSELEVQALAPDEQSTPAPTVKPDDLTTLPESWQAEIKSLRKEAADRRSKLSAYEKQEEDRKAATLSDVERANSAAKTATDRATALEAKLIQRDAHAALSGANMIDADLAYLAIKDKIVIEDGEATNLDDLVTELVKNKPHLVRTPPDTTFADARDRSKPFVPDTKSTSPSATPPAPRGRVLGKI